MGEEPSSRHSTWFLAWPWHIDGLSRCHHVVSGPAEETSNPDQKANPAKTTHYRSVTNRRYLHV